MKRLKGVIDEMGYSVVQVLIALGVVVITIAIIVTLIARYIN